MPAAGPKSLEAYRRKRDFTRTQEPDGAARAARKTAATAEAAHAFVIQKHAATRLHYDLRLELDGVLKSWAVTRGPSLVPGEKRLAVEVEDHPLDYADFEGVIPVDNYGAGEVIVWDRGTWTPDADPHAGLAKGHLSFALAGEKLQGGWHLVRLPRRGKETRSNWLLIKAQDEFAGDPGDPEVTETSPLSVKSGRPIEALQPQGAKERKLRGVRAKPTGPIEAGRRSAKVTPVETDAPAKTARPRAAKTRTR